ncbi:MAG: DsbA family protein [Alphaproteobacteria bacterium]|nr:DsbA family protein [Alphaproteobacteria bacterium]
MRASTASLLTAFGLLVAFWAYSSFTTPPVSQPAGEQTAQTAPQQNPAFDIAALNAEQRTSLRKEVRDYLLDQPEVLMEAIAVLESRQKQQQVQSDVDLIAANSAEIFNDGYSWSGGNPNGDITLVEFQDYRCAYCRRAHNEIKELVASDGNIRLVVKEFPILGEQSTLSSRLAVATLHKAGPDAYTKLADILIRFKGNLTENNMTGILNKLGLDAPTILAYMNDDAVKGQIGKGHALASKLNITGTPTFVVGGEMLRGYVPLAKMREIIKGVRTDRS